MRKKLINPDFGAPACTIGRILMRKAGIVLTTRGGMVREG